MATVLDAAEYIQEQIEEDNIPYFKLERLCYYAQAWSKAGDEEPIYPEAFSQAKRALCNELFDGVGYQLFVSLADSTGDADALTTNRKVDLCTNC